MRIAFIGDIVVKDKEVCLSDELQMIFNNCDICVCNFEAPIINLQNDKPIIKAGPNIFQTEKGIELLKHIGINLVSLANNHILDYGKNGLRNTICTLQKGEINFIGAGFSFQEAYKPYVIKSSTQSIAVIACSHAEFGVYKQEKDTVGYSWVNHPEMNRNIAELKKQVDAVYVFVHAGLEDEIYPLPEWRTRYKELIDVGADCVIGSHPHIIQGYEVYKSRCIFYSLGNFYFENNNNDMEWNRSIAVICDTNNIQKTEIIPCVSRDNLIEIDKTKETQVDIKKRSMIFDNNDDYIQKIDDMAERLWKEYYASFYKWNYPCISDYTIKKLIKCIIKKILHKPFKIINESIIDKTMLLHNIQIETHRWIVERYLYNENKKRNNL